jgi:Flp pilus assembly protein TadD
MKRTQSDKRQWLVSFCAGSLLAALCLAGCSEPARPAATKTDWTTNSTDRQFEAEADRPPTTKTLWAMARILAIQGKDSQCEYVLNRIIRQDPKFLPARNSLAELQMRQERTEAAIETLQDALTVQPDDPVLLNNLGMCWMVRRDYEKALQMFDKAAGLKPENKKYRANMAVALGLMGREEESLSLFKQIMPEDEAIHNLDVLRQAQKKTEKQTPAVTSATATPHQATK